MDRQGMGQEKGFKEMVRQFGSASPHEAPPNLQTSPNEAPPNLQKSSRWMRNRDRTEPNFEYVPDRFLLDPSPTDPVSMMYPYPL